jgi:hypothetical protein
MVWEMSKHEDRVNSYAREIACEMSAKFYPEAKGWNPMPDTMGLLSQIKVMLFALQREPGVRVNMPCSVYLDRDVGQ